MDFLFIMENSNTFISRILPIDIVDSSNISRDVGIIEENETVKNKGKIISNLECKIL